MEHSSPGLEAQKYELTLDDLLEVCEPFGSELTEYIAGLDLDVARAYIYGEILSEGGDPGEFFELAGIVEPEQETE